MATQTISSLRSLSVEIQVADTQDGKLSTVFQIDTFRILDDVYLNSKLTTYVLSNNTIQRILMYISFFTSIHQFGLRTRPDVWLVARLVAGLLVSLVGC